MRSKSGFTTPTTSYLSSDTGVTVLLRSGMKVGMKKPRRLKTQLLFVRYAALCRMFLPLRNPRKRKRRRRRHKHRRPTAIFMIFMFQAEADTSSVDSRVDSRVDSLTGRGRRVWCMSLARRGSAALHGFHQLVVLPRLVPRRTTGKKGRPERDPNRRGTSACIANA